MIDNFRGYDWETSLEDIQTQEVTSGMKEAIDYSLKTDESSGLEALMIVGGSVDKYDAEVYYVFMDDKLIAGSYDMDVDEENFDDISDGITEKYGEPVLEKESTGWGKCALWVDADGGCITLSGIMDLTYYSPDSPYLEMVADSFEEFHEIDLLNEIEKVGDGYVGY